MLNIVTGEKIQQLCDIYLGKECDLNYNPIISIDKSKHVYLNDINDDYNNPYYVFCYTHNINLLSTKISFFLNKFILVTHNSDANITETNEIINVLNCEKVLKWYGQNICFEHPKLFFLPIGIANSMWRHGNLRLFQNDDFMNDLNNKTKKIYFNFNINTNITTRLPCYNALVSKLEWLNNIEPTENLKRLKNYEFCVCPQGNGVDTHRLWECLYLKVVPIVIKSNCTDTLIRNGIPLLVLNSWDELDKIELNYNAYNFDNKKLVEILNLKLFM